MTLTLSAVTTLAMPDSSGTIKTIEIRMVRIGPSTLSTFPILGESAGRGVMAVTAGLLFAPTREETFGGSRPERTPNAAMDFIFMLTRDDVTIPNCRAVLDQALARGLTHIGFKDVGVDAATLHGLTERIRAAGALSYMEVVSESAEAALGSARLAAQLGVDRLLGGTEVQATLEILSETEIAYYPFVGLPAGHPTRLHGGPDQVAAHCRAALAAGAAGVDLLAFRAVEARPMALVTAAREALGDGRLLVAGSIDGPERLRVLEAAGVDGFTIGTAIFKNSFAPTHPGLGAQLDSVLACLN